MKPSLELLSQQFTALIGSEAFAKAETAIAAHQAAVAEATAKAAAAAKAAAEAAAAKAAAAAAAPKPATPVAGLAEPGKPASPTPATTPKPAVSASAAVTTIGAGLRPALPATPRPAAPTAAAAPKPAAPALPPPPPLPLQKTNHAEKGFDLDASIAPSQLVAAAQLLDAQGFGLDAVTGVDWIAQNEMEVVYDFFHPTEPLRIVIRTRLPRANPELPTISTVFPGADWHERETHDFFGIRFAGHPNLKPFLLPEDADFHPLRKDYNP